MLLKVLIAIQLFSTIATISTNHLVELPLHVPEEGLVINATLTDINGHRKYYIQELISTFGSTVKGKIVISNDKDSYMIHYNTDSYTGVDSKERLVIHGTNCLLFTYKKSWDSSLPGINKPLLNYILLIGPSILHRLDHSSFVWATNDSHFENVRGVMMRSATSELNNRLKITYYYKKYFDDETGIKNPSRIEFRGYDPAASSFSFKENLILDIFFQNVNIQDQIQNEVEPSPGIGCPHYLSRNKELPALKVFHMHFTMDERTEGSTTSRTLSQVHAAQFYGFLRLKTSLQGAISETIYDYALGVAFLIRADGSHAIQSIGSDTPGIDMQGVFTLANFFMLDGDFRYLGKVNLEHPLGITVEVWESVQYDVNIGGNVADKAVITQYFVEQLDEYMFWGYTLVRTKISLYKYDASKKIYTWTNGITRDYLNFQEARSTESIRSLIEKVKYVTSDERLILNFVLECDDSDISHSDCIKHTENRVSWLKGDFLYYILLAQPVSILRITDIQYRFTDEKVEMEVKFLDLPNLESIFNSKSMFVSQETFSKMGTITADNEADCLGILSIYQIMIKVVIYRPSDHACGYLYSFSELKEDVKFGQSCSVYQLPLHNLHRIKQELTLDQIHDIYLQDVGRKFSLFDGQQSTSFKLIDVIDKTEKDSTLFEEISTEIRWDAKLKIDDEFTVAVPDAKTIADCYRNCHDSEQVVCNTFSLCHSTLDCRVSSLISSDVTGKDSHIEVDKKCTIFSVNILNDYSKVFNRKFKTQLSTAVQKDPHTCAESCHASPDCISFQYCDGSCSFGSLFTDSDTQYDEECVIYFPKASEKYQRTGNKIVSDVIFTETKLTLDQCAALCYGWQDEDTFCESFNYCPKSKTESSCSLTQFSVRNSNTKINEGGGCSNYELKDLSKEIKRKDYSQIEVNRGISGSEAFGIIMLFLFVGVLLGFISPYAYSKIRQIRDSSKIKETFSWNRQVNELLENND